MIIAISGRIGSGKDTVGQMIQFHLTNEKRIARGVVPVLWSTFTSSKNQTLSNSRNWDESDTEIKKFAYKLKQMVSLMTGIPVEDLEKEEVKNSILRTEWDSEQGMDGMFPQPYTHRYTVRELLQKFGTNAVRDHVHQNAWVNALFADYKPTNRCTHWTEVENPEPVYAMPNWIITDCRFPNEAEAIEQRGGLLIRVERIKPRLISIQATEEDQAEHDRLAEIFAGASHSSETALDNYKFSETIINDGTIEDLLVKVRALLVKHSILKKYDLS